MKKIVLAMLLVAAVTAVAQTPPAPAQPAPTQSAPTQAAPAQAAPTQAAPTQTAPTQPAPKKEMKDPAEYNAYVGAAGQTDAAAQISGFEAFLTQYPNSAYKEDALELLMAAYQKTGNQAKTLETAQKVLVVNPCNIRALALVAYTKQAMTTGPNAQQNLAEAGQAGEKGLQCVQTATKPDGTSAADWDKLKATTTGIFNNAAGMSAYAAKDYAKAERFLRAAVEGDPTNLTAVYYLALAYLAPGPAEKDLDGLFFIARAASLQTGAGKDQIVKFGKSKYAKYHGNPAQIKRWLKGAIRGLMFVRDRPEEAVDLGIKKLQLGKATRAMVVEGTKNYVRALPQGVPGLPSAEGIKNFLEYDIKIPLQIKDDIPPERLLQLRLVEEVKKELEASLRR